MNKAMKTYYGFVYLWHDTKKNKFIIGSHHGKLEDGYTTSTGGKYVQDIFKSRPDSMRRKILEYCFIDDPRETQKIEQKWLDLRPNISEDSRYYNAKQWATGGIDRRIYRYKPESWIMNHRERQKELAKKGKHNFTSEHAKKWANKRVEEGTHHFLTSEFNKKPFQIFLNGELLGTFESKVEATKRGIKAHIVDKLRKYGTYKLERGSYNETSTNELYSFSKNDILEYKVLTQGK